MDSIEQAKKELEGLTSQEREEKEETQTGPAPELTKEEEVSAEEAVRIKETKIARMTQVLDRGILNDRLQRIVESATPKGRVGTYVRNTPDDIIRHQNLGYTFEVTESARGLHATGDGHVVVGDVVVMTISKEDFEILTEVKLRRIRRNIGEGRREYMSTASAKSPEGIVPFDESVTEIG